MRWRFSGLNWWYGIGELVIVAAGVLIALGVGEWNTARLAHLEEGQIVDRLIADLNDDLYWLTYESDTVDQKIASLRRIRKIWLTAGAVPEDPVAFLQDIILGADFGWNQTTGRRTTYSDILSSGKFALIEDANLRTRIAEYYDALADRFMRMDERETQFPDASYRLVPRVGEGINAGDYGREPGARLDDTLSPAEIDRIVARVLASDIGDYVDAEINLGQFIQNTGMGMRRQAEELVTALETYRHGR